MSLEGKLGQVPALQMRNDRCMDWCLSTTAGRGKDYEMILRLTRILFIVAVGVLFPTACGKVASPVAATPSPTPAPPPAGYAGVVETSPPKTAPASPTPQLSPSMAPEPAATMESVTAPAKVNLDTNDAENRAVKQEVLKRIDLMPKLSDEEKDKLYVQVERARGMGKVMTIPFPSGSKYPQASATESLVKAVKQPQFEKFSQDPTVVFVVLGYADTKGDPKANLSISTQRAETVVKILKDRAGVVNLIHSVGMGGSDLFDSGKREKNRVVEVWAVLP